ncbi:unnamed protein product [Brachionus calyciflorus]|uniref:EGF-like domain-containing protein n=1 Tax=Brachionus calyciflorus TaxID=104777 RepID=A0A814BY44_9BILA|nr:unnamed protein product [Brachionus calyciflorus]
MFSSQFILFVLLLIKNVDLFENSFISASDDGFIKIWNMSSEIAAIFKPVKFKCIEFLNTSYLAVGAHNGEISIWNYINMTQFKLLKHNNVSINDLLLVNKTILISASDDGSLKFWNTENFEELKYFEKAHDQGIKTLKLFNITSFISMCSNVIKEWSLVDFSELSKVDGFCVYFISADVFFKMNIITGCAVYTRIFDSSKIQLYYVLPETPARVLKVLNYPFVACGLQNAHISKILALEYIPDDILITAGLDGFIKIWNLTSQILIKEYKLNGIINDLILVSNYNPYQTTYEATTTEIKPVQTFYEEYTRNEAITAKLDVNKTAKNEDTEYSYISKSSKDQSTESIQIKTEYNNLLQGEDNNSDILEVSDIEKIFNLLKMNFDLNDCLTNCSNKGLCRFHKNIKKYVCECNLGFFGESCQRNSNPCSSNPCFNAGLCTLVNKSLFKCECLRDYYTGDFCEKEIDLCQNETCFSQGICTVQNLKSKCVCFDSFYGEKCEIESYDGLVRKIIIKTGSIIAIITLFALYLILILIDFSNLI